MFFFLHTVCPLSLDRLQTVFIKLGLQSSHFFIITNIFFPTSLHVFYLTTILTFAFNAIFYSFSLIHYSLTLSFLMLYFTLFDTLIQGGLKADFVHGCQSATYQTTKYPSFSCLDKRKDFCLTFF